MASDIIIIRIGTNILEIETKIGTNIWLRDWV
jgi:hypothetical protein